MPLFNACSGISGRSVQAVGLVALFVASACSVAQAQHSALRLVVLQRGDVGVDAALRARVDELVLRSLQAHERIESAYVSPVPSEEVELAAGCTTQDAVCLRRIAATLGADWLMVRELSRNAQGSATLTLVAHDGPDAAVTRRAVSPVAAGSADEVVPILVERLYPSPERSTRASPSAPDVVPAAPPKRETPNGSPLAAVGWSATAATVGLLASGAIVGALSQRDQREYARQSIVYDQDVDHAARLHAQAQKRANVANGLFYAAGGTAVIATGTLLWHYLRPRQADARPVQLGMAPTRGGAALSVQGSWQGGF